MPKVKKTIKDSIAEACKREIDMAEYYIGLYTFKATKLTDKDAITKNELKIKQMQDAKKSNEEALAMVEEYNATL